MTKIAAVILFFLCIYLVKIGIRSRHNSTPPDYIATVRYIGAAIFLIFFVVGLFTTDKTLLEFFSFLWK